MQGGGCSCGFSLSIGSDISKPASCNGQLRKITVDRGNKGELRSRQGEKSVYRGRRLLYPVLGTTFAVNRSLLSVQQTVE